MMDESDGRFPHRSDDAAEDGGRSQPGHVAGPRGHIRVWIRRWIIFTAGRSRMRPNESSDRRNGIHRDGWMGLVWGRLRGLRLNPMTSCILAAASMDDGRGHAAKRAGP